MSRMVKDQYEIDEMQKAIDAKDSVGGVVECKVTGMPVGINLSLSFMETQIITKEYYRNDSGTQSINQRR
jgi:chorismate synthase